MVAFWSPARVAEALRADTLSERDKLQLVVASVILADLFGSLGILYALRAPVFLVPSLLGMAITFIGLYASFRGISEAMVSALSNAWSAWDFP